MTNRRKQRDASAPETTIPRQTCEREQCEPSSRESNRTDVSLPLPGTALLPLPAAPAGVLSDRLKASAQARAHQWFEMVHGRQNECAMTHDDLQPDPLLVGAPRVA